MTGYEKNTPFNDFYYVAVNGKSAQNLSYSMPYDNYEANMCFDNGNYYNNKNLVEKVARAEHLNRMIKQWRAFHDENKTKGIYTISYNYNKSALTIENYSDQKPIMNFGLIFFSTFSTAIECIQNFKDELEWYFTEYNKPSFE